LIIIYKSTSHNLFDIQGKQYKEPIGISKHKADLSETILIWPLNSDPGPWRSTIYGLQWFAFTVANIAVLPVFLGTYLGLDQAGIADYAQRMFFFVGLASFLQILFGHRLTIIEGPAAPWWAVIVSFSGIAAAIGKPLELVRSDLVGAMLVCGLMLMLLGFTGVIGRIMKLFTPPIIGCVLILLCLQLSGTFISGILGESTKGDSFNYAPVLISIVVIATIVMLSMKAPPLLRSINILIGLGIGWILYAFIVQDPAEAIKPAKIVEMPQLFAWGPPTFDPGVTFTGVLISLIILANLLASIAAMSKTTDKLMDTKGFDRAVVFNGISNLMAGVGASVGTVPFAASTGLVKISGVASRKPFFIFCLLMMATGFFPQVGAFLARIPQPVGYAVLLAAFTQILIVGLQELKKMNLDQRDSFVIGLTILTGAGVATMPETALVGLPDLVRYMLGNALIVGMIICVLMEHVVLPRR